MEINKDTILNSKKIAIFGWPATGKSTFANQLSKITKIPVYSLDILRWNNSINGKKDNEQFLSEYNKLLKREKWIIEGNALDWILPRLEQSDLLIFFDSTIDKSINNFISREQRIKNNIEKRKNFEVEKSISNEETIDWIKNRYSKKIDKLKLILKDYENKLIIVKDYKEVDLLLKSII